MIMKLADLLYRLPENAYIWVYILARDYEKDDNPKVLWKGFVKEFPYFIEQKTNNNVVHLVRATDTDTFHIYLI